MNTFEIAAEARDLQGKGASRRLRRAGYVPGILYGAGKDPVTIQLPHNEVLKHTEHEAFYSQILTLQLPTGGERVVLKDMQRHPFKAQIMHMDFLRINENETLTMRVPIHFMNEDKCAGVKTGGGVISHLMTELEIVCLPRDLPEYIEVDVEALELGDAIHLSELNMPENVEIASLLHGGDPAQSVVSVQIPRAIEEPEEMTEGEAVEGEEGAAEAAPPAEDAGAAEEGDD